MLEMMIQNGETLKRNLMIETSGSLCGGCNNREACGRISSQLLTLQHTLSPSEEQRRGYLSIRTHLERAGYHYPHVKTRDECWFMGKKGVVNYYDKSLAHLLDEKKLGAARRA